MHGLFKWAFSVSVPFACVLAGVAALVTWQLSPLIGPDLTTILLIAFLLVPIASIAKLSGSALQGLHHVLLGQIPLSVLNSALFFALIVSAYLFFAPLLTAASAVAANVFASSIACIAAVYLLCLKTPKSQPGTSLSYQTPSWLRSAFAFLFVDIVHYINSQADILILGALGGMEDVGLYRPATRVMLLVSFGLNAMNMALRPVVARSHAAGDHDRLQSLVTAAAKLTMLYAIPSVIFVIVFGQWILSLYGAPFIVGYKALVILALGQLVNTGMGAVALLLNMTGHQSTVLKGVGLAAILNVFLNFVLIPRFGIVGAALASALSMIVWNGLLFVAVRRTLGISPTVLRRASL